MVFKGHYSWLIVLLSLVFNFHIHAQSILPFGISMNMSGSLAQYSLDFKNGIEAKFQAANRDKKFKGNTFSLIAIDDQNQIDRAVANTQRLINQKKILALFSTHSSLIQQTIADISTKNKTLFLTSTSDILNIPNLRKEYIAFIAQNTYQQIIATKDYIHQSDDIIILSEDKHKTEVIKSAINEVKASNTNITVITDIKQTELNNNHPYLFVINQNFISAASNIQLITQIFPQAYILVMPDTGSDLSFQTLKKSMTAEQLAKVIHINTVPLHKSGLKLIRQFKREMKQFNPSASANHQALKGYILAHLLTEATYHSMKGLKTESLLEVLTLPFQLLDNVVGWVKHSGSDMTSSMIAEQFIRIVNYDAGLDKLISLSKERTLLDEIYFTQLTPSGEQKPATKNLQLHREIMR